MDYKEKIEKLRDLMLKEGFEAYIVPSTDPHLSEYLPDNWQYNKWLSGFSGSAGTIVITRKHAGLWTDSRYFLQAEQQLKDSGIELMRLKVPHTAEYIKWLYDNLPKGSTVGYCAMNMSVNAYRSIRRKFKSKGIFIASAQDFVAELWTDRPPLPETPIYVHETEYTGITRATKINLVREEMEKKGIDYMLITTLDDIAWLMNIRGTDIENNPVVISYLLVGQNETTLFVNKNKMTDEVESELLDNNIKLDCYENVKETLAGLENNKTVLLDTDTTPRFLYELIIQNNKVIEDINIVAKMKAEKSEHELCCIKRAMKKDGVALVKFYRWLEQNVTKGDVTELLIAKKLEEFREQQSKNMGASFAPIVGYNEHGAIVHYSASEETNKTIEPKGILLIDSGGQYLDGTTDITRTITLGNPTEQQKKDFTLVLKGHINLSSCKFPKGTTGIQIDAMARRALWNEGLNYGHGTGHGVGFFLNVHEGPQSISATASPKTTNPLRKGMILSNEPGLYRTGKYGIRIENLIEVVEDCETEFGEFLKFNPLTIFPIDKALINKDLMTEAEIEWLNNYHKTVYEELNTLLDDEEKEWLKDKTSEL